MQITPGFNSLANDRSGKDLPTGVPHPHHIPFGYAARLSIVRMNGDRLTVLLQRTIRAENCNSAGCAGGAPDGQKVPATVLVRHCPAIRPAPATLDARGNPGNRNRQYAVRRFPILPLAVFNGCASGSRQKSAKRINRARCPGFRHLN